MLRAHVQKAQKSWGNYHTVIKSLFLYALQLRLLLLLMCWFVSVLSLHSSLCHLNSIIPNVIQVNESTSQLLLLSLTLHVCEDLLNEKHLLSSQLDLVANMVWLLYDENQGLVRCIFWDVKQVTIHFQLYTNLSFIRITLPLHHHLQDSSSQSL